MDDIAEVLQTMYHAYASFIGVAAMPVRFLDGIQPDVIRRIQTWGTGAVRATPAFQVSLKSLWT